MGRRIATGLYWAVAIYVIGAGFVSVIPQIFWPADAYGTERTEPSFGCPDALRALHTDLLRGAADHARDLGRDPAAPFLADWDQRYRALEPSCGDTSSYALLARLRYGVEEHLLRFDADLAPLAAETLRAIEADDRATH